jgi:flagellar biosynthesis protein FlhA
LICEPFRNQVGLVRVVILEPRLEHYFRQAVTGQVVALAPASLTRLVQRLKSVWEAASIKNEPAALLVDSTIRYALKQTIGRSLRDVTVLAHSEIPGNTSIDARMMIRFDEVVGADDSLVDFDLALEQEGERKSELVSS